MIRQPKRHLIFAILTVVGIYAIGQTNSDSILNVTKITYMCISKSDTSISNYYVSDSYLRIAFSFHLPSLENIEYTDVITNNINYNIITCQRRKNDIKTYYTVSTKKQLLKDKKVKSKYLYTDIKKEILGYSCQQIIVNRKANYMTNVQEYIDTIYVANAIPSNGLLFPYNYGKVKGMPLEISTSNLHYKAVEISEVKTPLTFFQTPDEYEKIIDKSEKYNR